MLPENPTPPGSSEPDDGQARFAPDCWPPTESGDEAPIESPLELPNGAAAAPFDPTPVPLFPLADVWLLPGAIAPLNIFEPRYRQMIEDSLDRSGRLVIGTVVRGHEPEMPGRPKVYPVAGLGEIVKHERRPDGTFILLLLGIARVELDEVESERMYRQVKVRTLRESPVPENRVARYRQELSQAVLERSEQFLNLPSDMPVAALADLLSLRLCLPHGRRQRFFAEADVENRVLEILAEHRRRPPAAQG